MKTKKIEIEIRDFSGMNEAELMGNMVLVGSRLEKLQKDQSAESLDKALICFAEMAELGKIISSK